MLAETVKNGGNLFAHFNSEVDANSETAEMMLNLTENLLEYFYILPKLIEEIEPKLPKPMPVKEHAEEKTEATGPSDGDQ
jgi:hypothetical protein